MTDTPIHHWTMDNISGSSVIDEVAGGENLTFTGRTQITGQFDYGLSGNTDTTQALQLAADRSFKALSLWFQRVSTANYSCFGAESTNGKILLISTGSPGNLGVYNGGLSYTNLTVGTGWHHLWIVEGSSNNQHWLYLDGTKASAQLTTGLAGVLKIFGRSDSAAGQENVAVDNIQWYDRIPTEAEIAYLAAATSQTQTLPAVETVRILSMLRCPYFLEGTVYGFTNQPYSILSMVVSKLEQINGLFLLATLAHNYGDAKVISTFLEQYYSSSRNIIKVLEQIYVKEIRTVVQLEQAFTLIGNILATSNQSYSITEQLTNISLSHNYNLELLNKIVSNLRQHWNITANEITTNAISYSVTISGVEVPSENVNINCDIEQHYIEGVFTLSKPDFFPLCVRKANVIITITVGAETKEFHLLLWEKTRTTTVSSTVYTLTCRSQSVLLDSKFSPTLQKEFPANLASTTVVELAAIHNIPVDWNVYESGQLVDELIPAGYLFANNEKPLVVIRKILEAFGAVMQSTPEGRLEIIHLYPKKVPSYQIEAIDIDLKTDIRYENVSTTSEERSGVNTIYVSDQLTSSISYTLEEEEISSISKFVKGFHTPWDSEEVYLDTSGGTSVLIEYLGVVTENMPPADSELPYELIEFVNGTGKTSKPIYTRNTIDWVMDSLGAITFAEDGTLTSEIPGESLLKITYVTKYHKWKVTSPTIKDVQCILRPVHE